MYGIFGVAQTGSPANTNKKMLFKFWRKGKQLLFKYFIKFCETNFFFGMKSLIFKCLSFIVMLTQIIKNESTIKSIIQHNMAPIIPIQVMSCHENVNTAVATLSAKVAVHVTRHLRAIE